MVEYINNSTVSNKRDVKGDAGLSRTRKQILIDSNHLTLGLLIA